MTDETVNGNSKVTFSVKELLQEIRDDVKSVAANLDKKADKSEVTMLMTRVVAVEDEQRDIKAREEQRQKDHQQDTDAHRFRVPLMVTVVMAFLNPFWYFALGHLFK